MGGATWTPRWTSWAPTGLSPSGRGNRRTGRRRHCRGGSIPAWAGQPSWPLTPLPIEKVYPRVGGANDYHQPPGNTEWGLSPRGRGKRNLQCGALRRQRSIPAWAGQTSSAPLPATYKQVYPRVGGANVSMAVLGKSIGGLSPRGRGKLLALFAWRSRQRSIPAWAGQTIPYRNDSSRNTVYPRVGGANTIPAPSSPWSGGLSPRGRGNLQGHIA